MLAAARSISCLVRMFSKGAENKGQNPIRSPLVSSATHRTPCNTLLDDEKINIFEPEIDPMRNV